MADHGEFYCQVLDKNVPGLMKHFDATVQFLDQELLIICMDFGASQRCPSEVYFKTRPNEQYCPTYHKLAYHAIRFVMLRDETLTIYGDRQNVQIRLRGKPREAVESVFAQLISYEISHPNGDPADNVISARPMFAAVTPAELRSFIGTKSYEIFTAIMNANNSNSISSRNATSDGIKFWINIEYGVAQESNISTSVYACLRDRAKEEAMERICHVIRRILIELLMRMTPEGGDHVIDTTSAAAADTTTNAITTATKTLLKSAPATPPLYLNHYQPKFMLSNERIRSGGVEQIIAQIR